MMMKNFFSLSLHSYRHSQSAPFLNNHACIFSSFSFPEKRNAVGDGLEIFLKKIAIGTNEVRRLTKKTDGPTNNFLQILFNGSVFCYAQWDDDENGDGGSAFIFLLQ